MAFLRSAALVLAVLAPLACTRHRVSLNEGPREYVATDYETVLRKWTRSEQLIKVRSEERRVGKERPRKEKSTSQHEQ
jgi:hypothetical protein